MDKNERYKQAKKVTLIGGATNLVLSILKLFGGFAFHSHALIADGVHSLADLLTDGLVLVASRHGNQDADTSHPYGHQRIETAAVLLLSLFLIFAGIGIAWDAIDEMIRAHHDQPDWLAVPIAALSVVANELLFHYTRMCGIRIQSPLIITNAWHHRSDAASSLIVLVGVIGSLAGFLFLDALAAIVVSLLIIQMGCKYSWSSLKELVDTAVDPKLLHKIQTTIGQVDGVLKMHQLRTRMMGKDVFVDVHVLVNPFISVSEGHYIAQKVQYALQTQEKSIKDVTVHIDPEDDEIAPPSSHLPDRHTLEQSLFNAWQKDYPALHGFTLHYLEGALTIDCICSQLITPWQPFKQRITHDLRTQSAIRRIRFLINQETLKL